MPRIRSRMLAIAPGRARTQLNATRTSHTRRKGEWLVLALMLCLAGFAFATVADAAEISSLENTLVAASTGSAPVLSVSGETVQWSAVGSETYYEIAISNEPRGAAGRTTQYLSIARKPGETQTYTITLEPGHTVYIGV